jgi:hypothetical protein
MYLFMHLATITELNGWDSMNPGHLDRYLLAQFIRLDIPCWLLDIEKMRNVLREMLNSLRLVPFGHTC